MKRYHIVNAKPRPMIRMEFSNIQNDEDRYYFDVSPGDRVSILYIDYIHRVGQKKEYVIDGKVKRLLFNQNSKMPCALLVDAGGNYRSNLVTVLLENILDINRYPHRYDLEEDIKVVPNPKERFLLHEKTLPQDVDMSIPNDPFFGDHEYIEEEVNEDERELAKLDET